MIEKFAELVHLAYRQENSIYVFIDMFKKLFTGGFSFKGVITAFLAFAECIGCVLFDTPVTPRGDELDLSGYELVFEDEFEGDALDTDVWFTRGNGKRRSGYNAASQVSVENGNLVITGEYRDASRGEYGEGWYVGAVALKENRSQGYYEIRCKCNPGNQFWSAFWIQAVTNPYDHYISQGGVNGAEIDIFEAMSWKNTLPANRNAVTSTIHCNGWDDDIENIDSRCLGEFKVGNDIYNEYNTYGLEWTEDEYIFYINGVETARSSFGNGVSQVPEQLIVSLEIPDEEIQFDHDYTTEFVVDYVRIYQKTGEGSAEPAVPEQTTGFWDFLKPVC